MRRPSYAYLDGGTAAMVFQMAVAGILGVGLVLKTYWWRVKELFTGKRKEDREDSVDDE